MQRLGYFFVLLTPFLLNPEVSSAEDGFEAVYDVTIDAPLDAVWKAFTTNEGLKTWMAPLVEIDLAVGGQMKSNYNPKGEIGDKETIVNTILSYDPKRMLSLKTSKFPEGFAFAEAAAKTWSVFYFSADGERTKIRVVGLGYTDDEQSKKMRTYFAAANKFSLGNLAKALNEKPRPVPPKK